MRSRETIRLEMDSAEHTRHSSAYGTHSVWPLILTPRMAYLDVPCGTPECNCRTVEYSNSPMSLSLLALMTPSRLTDTLNATCWRRTQPGLSSSQSGKRQPPPFSPEQRLEGKLPHSDREAGRGS